MLARIDSFARTALRPALALLGVASILLYVLIAFVHVRYPFELEWIEGGMVDEVRRAVAGERLYVKPTLDYVPFIYAPLWFYAAAVSAKIFGVGFFSARLVSVLASLGCMAIVASFVHRERRDRFASIAAAGVFAATYPLAAAFYDLARVDSLFLVLTLGALWVVRFRPTTQGSVIAAVLFALAFLTKQSAPIVLAPVALHVLLEDRRRGIVFAGVAGALILAAVAILNRASDGWFWHFVITLPAQHPRVKRVLLTFWLDDLLARMPIVCLFAIYYAVVAWRERASREAVPERRFYLLAAVGMIAASLAGRIHLGGWANVCAPAYAILAVLFGLGLSDAITRAAPAGVRAFALVAAVVQLAAMIYDPRPYLPSAAHEKAWRELLATVEGTDGDVYVSAHGFVGTRAGKPMHAHQMALSDELRSGTSDSANDLRRDVRRSLHTKRFRAIVLDNEWMPKTDLEPNYDRARDVPDHDRLGPVIGWRTAQPSGIWVPKP